MTEEYPILHKGRLITKASKAMILLHGRGGSARDILSLADTLCDDQFYIAAPQAANNSWYPHGFMTDEKLNQPYLSRSIEVVRKLIDEIAQYVSKEKIYLIGFSQGACLALETSARYARHYGGIAAFSGGLIGHEIDEKKYHGDFEGTKVFIGNSDLDPHVPLIRSEQSAALMEKHGAHVTFKIYKGMGHIINQDELSWVKKNMLA